MNNPAKHNPRPWNSNWSPIGLLLDNESNILKFDVDPIAIYWARYRISSERSTVRADDTTSVSDEDHKTAMLIRKYYQYRYTMKVIAGGTLTEFQNKLYKFLNDGIIQDKDIGMLYRLPYFYNEDIMHDLLKEQCTTLPSQSRTLLLKTIKVITPCQRIMISRSAGNKWEYWWKTEENYPVCLSFPVNCNLGSIIESLFNTKNNIKISASWTPIHSPYSSVGFSYWNINNSELVFT